MGGASEVVILSLDLSCLPVEKVRLRITSSVDKDHYLLFYLIQGYDLMLVSLSTMILEGLKDLGMSSSIGFQYLEKSALRGRVDGSSISYIFKYLKVPILVLVDEVQNLLLPRDPNSGEVDKTSQISAGKLLKELSCKSSSSCETSPCHAGPKPF